MSHLRVSKTIIALAFIGAVCLSSPAQGDRQLYLVTGLSPSRHFPVGSAVFGVDLTKHALIPITTLVEPKGGIDYLLADHDRRLLVVGTPYGRPEKVVILSMDAPQNPRTVPITMDGVAQASILEKPDGSVQLALDEFHDDKPRLKAVSLLPGDSGTTIMDLPWTDYRFQRSEGWWSPADESSRDFLLQAKDDGATVWRGGVFLDSGIVLPKEIAADADQKLSVAANNDAVLVIERRLDRGAGKDGPAGRVRLSIYDKQSQRWRTDDFFGIGGATSIRVFGPWVIVNAGEVRRDISTGTIEIRGDEKLKVSPGANLRQKPVNPGSLESIPVDYLFQRSSVAFSGTMHLYDARSGARYRIDTGQGDSEILLVDGTNVYYRVNDGLYRAQITKGKANLEGIEIARDDNIQLAHWAFFGP